MPIPFLVPAGMMAVRIGGKWVLKKIAKRLARRTRLKPKTEKILKKKAAKQGRKLQKKKAQEPVYSLREKMLRKDNRTMANIDPVNKKLRKTVRKSQERKYSIQAAEKHHKAVKRLYTDKKAAEDYTVKEVSNILIGGKRGQMHPATWRNNMQRHAEKLGKEIKEEKKKLKKSIKKRKRTRQLKEDVQRRRN